ncbi:MAG: GAF domain-containing protein [Bacteroidota bacterium]
MASTATLSDPLISVPLPGTAPQAAPGLGDDFPFRRVLSLDGLLDFWRARADEAAGFEAEQARALVEAVEATPALLGDIEDPAVLREHGDLVQALMSALIPSGWLEGRLAFAIPPFALAPFFETPTARRLGLVDALLAFLSEPGMASKHVFKAYDYILTEAYGADAQMVPFAVTLVDPDDPTGLPRHFQLRFDTRFCEVVKADAAPAALPDDVLRPLLADRTDLDRWTETLPPEHYTLRGFAVMEAAEVTMTEELSALRRDLVEADAMAGPGAIEHLEQRLRTVFRQPDLDLGVLRLARPSANGVRHGEPVGRSLLLGDACGICAQNATHVEAWTSSFYSEARTAPVIIDDLQQRTCSVIGQTLAEVGYRTLVVAPLRVGDEFVGFLELGSARPSVLSALNVREIEEIATLFASALKRNGDAEANRLQALIKQQYTAIHPSVEWRFLKAARSMLKQQAAGEQPRLASIAFDNVHALYGQSDIRGSSEARVEAIRTDSREQLTLARAVLRAAQAGHPAPAFDLLAYRIEQALDALDRERPNVGDESNAVTFLHAEVEPHLDVLAARSEEAAQAVTAYRDALDPKVGVLYRERKRYEDSVTLINDTVADVLDRQQVWAQRLVPHFFEKYKTDGVDYTMYAGTSLLEDSTFTPLDLQNLRLWQLMTTCSVGWALDAVLAQMPLALRVAHLILAQHNPLAIRFRPDEKQFDIDGAYNVRYAIVKKRIDKATVAGTGERLTQPGQIAVVYSNRAEREEYLQYLGYLRHLGYIEEAIEDLDLADMQGVRGLHALRVAIAATPPAHSGDALPDDPVALVRAVANALQVPANVATEAG